MKKAILSAVAASVIAPVTFAEEIYAGVDMTKDVAIKTSAGYTLKGNLFKPTTEGEYPVIVTMTPYGKDKEPHYGPEDGIIDASEYAAYKAHVCNECFRSQRAGRTTVVKNGRMHGLSTRIPP